MNEPVGSSFSGWVRGERQIISTTFGLFSECNGSMCVLSLGKDPSPYSAWLVPELVSLL